MAEYTTNLELYKKDPVADKNDTFNIETMLNENWDKLDEEVGKKADKEYVDGAIEGIDIDVPVTSVNEKTGDVELGASDVGASPIGHEHTPSQVGLGKVLNYGIATTAEARAGTSNTKYMTPALVKTATQHLAETGGISMVKSVQRGLSAGHNSKGNITIPISTIDASKAFVILDSSRTSETGSTGYNTFVPALVSLNKNNLIVTASASERKTNTFYPHEFSWQVIEYV